VIMASLNGTICTPEDYLQPEAVHCFVQGEIIGMTVVTCTAFISLFAVLYFFLRVLINVISASKTRPKRSLVSNPMDVYMLSLFAANLLHAVGDAINIKWLHNGKSFQGTACTAQGVLQGMASSAVALSTLVIAVHTFITVFRPKSSPSLFASQVAVVCLWALVIVITGAISGIHRAQQDYFYVPSPEWCWINEASSYLRFKFPEEYIWLWTALVVSIATYVPLSIWSFKHLEPSYRRQVAMLMLLYPVVYSVLVIPETVVRWLEFGHTVHIKYPATLAVQAIFDLNGFIDVVVFLSTRRGLLLFDTEEVTDPGSM